MPSDKGKSAVTGNEMEVHLRNAPSWEGGQFMTTLTRQQGSLVKQSLSTYPDGTVVPGSVHGEVIFTGPNPSGSFRIG